MLRLGYNDGLSSSPRNLREYPFTVKAEPLPNGRVLLTIDTPKHLAETINNAIYLLAGLGQDLTRSFTQARLIAHSEQVQLAEKKLVMELRKAYITQRLQGQGHREAIKTVAHDQKVMPVGWLGQTAIVTGYVPREPQAKAMLKEIQQRQGRKGR